MGDIKGVDAKKEMHHAKSLFALSNSYVLRHTGQIVGEEDEGVLPLFRELLCCEDDGRAKKQ